MTRLGVVLSALHRQIGANRRDLRRAIPAFNLTRDPPSLKNYANPSFADRAKSAAEAKKKLLEKFKNAPKPDEAQLAARRAEREAADKAREARRVERERMKAEEKARKEAELAEKAAAALAAEKAAADALVAEEAAKKAARDERYAARKARKR